MDSNKKLVRERFRKGKLSRYCYWQQRVNQSALIDKKLAPSNQLIGFNNAGYPYPPKEADCITIDITSCESLEKVMEVKRYQENNQLLSD